MPPKRKSVSGTPGKPGSAGAVRLNLAKVLTASEIGNIKNQGVLNKLETSLGKESPTKDLINQLKLENRKIATDLEDANHKLELR